MRISRREKIWIAGGAGVLLVLLVLLGVVLPAVQAEDRLDARIASSRETLKELLVLRGQWEEIQGYNRLISKRLRDRGPDFSMFRHLEELARKAGVDDHIQYMRPVTLGSPEAREGMIRKSLEVRLNGVGLNQLTRYLYLIEFSEKLLAVESIHLKPVYTDPQQINVTFRVFTLEKA